MTWQQFMVGALLTLLGFVVGFFTNLIAMRSMFVGKKEFEEFKVQSERSCELKRDSCAPMAKNIEEIKQDIRELFAEIRTIIRDQNGR